MQADELRIGLTAFESLDEAQRFARELVNQRLAACAQVLPEISSFYWWQGSLEVSNEYLVLFKTKAGLEADIEAFFNLNHSYETPELVLIPASYSSPGYLDWLAGELKR